MVKYPQIEVIDEVGYVVWDELIGNGKEAHIAIKFAAISDGQVFHTEMISFPIRDAWAPNIIQHDTGELMAAWVEKTDEGNKIKRTVINEIDEPDTSLFVDSSEIFTKLSVTLSTGRRYFLLKN